MQPETGSTEVVGTSNFARLVLTAAVIALVGAWFAGFRFRAPDYDEIEHAHATWLVSRGYRPHFDFFENHPPATWYLLAPVARLFGSGTDLLLALRFLAALANAASIILLFNLVSRRVPRLWVAAGLLIAAALPESLNYLVEFRQDPFATALLFTAILLLVREWPSGVTVRYALFAFLGLNATLVSPKVLALFASMVAADFAINFFKERHRVRGMILGYLAGAASATLGALLAIKAAGLKVGVLFDLIVRYNGAFMKVAVFPEALRDRVAAYPLFALGVSAGGIAWLATLFRRRLPLEAFPFAVAVTLVLNLVFITLPYKQYVAPWFLIAGTLIPYCWVWTRRACAQLQVLPAVVILVLAAAGAINLGRHFAGDEGARFQRRYRTFLERNALAGGSVVVPVPLHPITARDATYNWVQSHDPLGGHDTESIMQTLGVEDFSQRFTRPHYRQELESADPDLVIPEDLTPGQLAEVRLFLTRHQDRYRAVAFEHVTMYVKNDR
jgi:hypothetical protein